MVSKKNENTVMSVQSINKGDVDNVLAVIEKVAMGSLATLG